MSCALTQGYTLGCRDTLGGVKEIYLIELANISTITEASGTVTAITKVTGKRFWKYQQFKETSEAKEDLKGSTETGGSWSEQTVSLVIPKMQVSVRNEIKTLMQLGAIAAVVKTVEGTSFLYGRENGLTLDEGTAGTGKARSDLNGYTINIAGYEKEPAPIVDATVVSGLETPA